MVNSNNKGGYYSLSPWMLKVLLYILHCGTSWFADLTRHVTGHPMRTRRVIKQLLKHSLIEEHVEYETLKPGTKPFKIVYYYLTPKGIKLLSDLGYI